MFICTDIHNQYQFEWFNCMRIYKVTMMAKTDVRVLTLEKHFELFERSADCNSLLGLLMMEGVISRLEMQRLQAERTQIERNRFVSSI